MIYLLTIAEGRLPRVRELAARYSRQAKADNLRTLIEHALAGGLVLDEIVPGRAAADQGGLRLTRSIGFVDLAVSDLRAEDIDELRRRRLTAEPIDMQFKDGGRRRVTTIDQYDAARDAGAYPAAATDLRCEGAFKNASAVFRAVANAREPLESYVGFPYVGVCDIAVVPSSLVQILGMYEAWKPYLERMPTIGDMVKNAVLSVEAIGSTFLRVKPNVGIPDVAVMETTVWELLRADLSGNGVEDLLVGIYGRAVGGSHGHSADPVILSRQTPEGVLEVA